MAVMAGRSEFYCEVVYHDDIPDSWPPSLIREIGILKQGTKFHRFFRTYSESVTREKTSLPYFVALFQGHILGSGEDTEQRMSRILFGQDLQSIFY